MGEGGRRCFTGPCRIWQGVGILVQEQWECHELICVFKILGWPKSSFGFFLKLGNTTVKRMVEEERPLPRLLE